VFLFVLIVNTLYLLWVNDIVHRKAEVLKKYIDGAVCPSPCELKIEKLIPEVNKLKMLTIVELFLIFFWWWIYSQCLMLNKHLW